MDVRDIAGVCDQKPQERSSCGQRVEAAGQQSGLGDAMRAIEHGILGSENADPMPVATQDANFHSGASIDATALAYEVIADENVHGSVAKVACPTLAVEAITSPGLLVRDARAETPPTMEQPGKSRVNPGHTEAPKLWFPRSRLTRGPMSTLGPISI